VPDDANDEPRSSADEPVAGGPVPEPTEQLPIIDPAPMPEPPSLPISPSWSFDASPVAELPPYAPSDSPPRWEPDASAVWQPSHAAVPTAQRPPRRRVWPVLVAIVLAAGLIGGGLAFGLSNSSNKGAAASAVPLVQSTVAAPRSNAAQMIQRILPSVVNVRVTVQTTDQFGQTRTGQAEGSGVILTKDGVIITNAHVVSGASSVKVVFTNGHASLDATVLGVDTAHDLAVIKVSASDLAPITVGHSNTLKLGDQVWAIGFPLDLGTTVTEGIISGLDRTIDVQRPDGSSEHLIGMLQTDAAINPGNSGGPLVDAAGQLVGINTAGASASVAQNVGFAIAIDGSVPIINQLAAGHSPSAQARAWLGVVIVSASNGVRISSVVPGGPAASAGLRAGDVITGVDRATIGVADDLTAALASHKPGDKVQVTVISRSGQRSVTVTLGTRPANLP
jgi:putative serine protease PepD